MIDDIEDVLRRSLADHADQAPAGVGLAERIVATAGSVVTPRRRSPRWRTWGLPLVAAGAVAAVVTALLATSALHHSAGSGIGDASAGRVAVGSDLPGRERVESEPDGGGIHTCPAEHGTRPVPGRPAGRCRASSRSST